MHACIPAPGMHTGRIRTSSLCRICAIFLASTGTPLDAISDDASLSRTSWNISSALSVLVHWIRKKTFPLFCLARRCKTLYTNGRYRAGFHNQCCTSRRAVPVDSSARCKYSRESAIAHRYFRRFFGQIVLTGPTCRFVQLPCSPIFIAQLAIASILYYNKATRDGNRPWLY